MTAAITDSFKLALAQLNPVVGDIAGNVAKARAARAEAAAKGADLVAFTELYLTGYPLEDLVLKPALQQAARAACEELARDTADGGPAILMGLPWAEGAFVYNAVALLDRGRIDSVRFKYNLPNYGVFDEKGTSLGLPQSSRRPGRARLRRCVFRAERQRRACRADARLGGGGGDQRMAPREGQVAMPAGRYR
jgi:predicted amidohydrolase